MFTQILFSYCPSLNGFHFLELLLWSLSFRSSARECCFCLLRPRRTVSFLFLDKLSYWGTTLITYPPRLFSCRLSSHSCFCCCVCDAVPGPSPSWCFCLIDLIFPYAQGMWNPAKHNSRSHLSCKGQSKILSLYPLCTCYTTGKARACLRGSIG